MGRFAEVSQKKLEWHHYTMDPTNAMAPAGFWKEDAFDFIKPEEFEALGVDPADIPPGTFPSRKYPSQIPSRFGGNAYGFGFFEVYDRLSPRDLEILQSVTHGNADQVKPFFQEINRIYKKIGLLIRLSNLGKPYYLIPIHLVSGTLIHIKNKADEISKIIQFHRKKFFQENHTVGLLTHADDLIINDLSVRFMEHRFIIIDSFDKLRDMNETLDMVILIRDIHEAAFMEKFNPGQKTLPSKTQLREYAIYMLGKIYQFLKKDGEIFVIADWYTRKTNEMVNVSFKTITEEKKFLLFSHIFKTKKKYHPKGKSLKINTHDFQRYLSGVYVEQEIIERLLEGRDIAKMTIEKMNNLPYLNFTFDDEPAFDQAEEWPKLLSTHFDEIFLKPLIPESIREDWRRRFSAPGHSPNYMLIYLGQKKKSETDVSQLKKDVMESQLSGCQLPLLAGYRDSFDFLIGTLKVLREIKAGRYVGLPDLFMERLRQPLVNKKRRYSAMNHVLNLMSKIGRLEKAESYLNPERIEGTRTKVLENMDTLTLFGFTYGELREIFLIIVGHTAIGRILSGKMNEKALKPVTDLARTLEPQQALNLLRYCRLMSLAETVTSRKTEMNREQLTELFDLYDAMVRVLTNREMDWDQLLDEKINTVGGIHNKIVRKKLKMMNHFQFLDNWSELKEKGAKEKESLAGYDVGMLSKVENVIKLARIIEQFENRYLKGDPLQLSIFYRKFLSIEFHGTGHTFERMDGRVLFLLLWITVNVVRGEIINFNPILADLALTDVDDHIKHLEAEAEHINTNHLNLATLRDLSAQLYEKGSSFVVGTGFQLKVNHETRALDISYIDLDENIRDLESLTKKFKARQISEIPVEKLEELERLFANLERFYQSHLRLISGDDKDLKLPERQRRWFLKARELRAFLRSNLLKVIFHPENVYSGIDLLRRHSRSILFFILPELMALQDLKLKGRIYLKSNLIDHVLKSTRKLQALIRRDRESLQDVDLLHKAAQREFGPMTAGIVGLNESQIETLESVVTRLAQHPPLFDALIKSFLFRDLGLIPSFREKYKDQFNPADHAQAGAIFLEKERIPERYGMDQEARHYLTLLVRYHDFIHHMIRGEFSLYSTQEIIDFGDKNFFDAFFLSSFIMFSAMREDLVLEDLATRQLRILSVCHKIIMRETTLEDHLGKVYSRNGHLYFALRAYQKNGLPPKMSAARFLETFEWKKSEEIEYIRVGKMVYAMERLFRLKGIRYVEFEDLARHIAEVPLKFIYKKRGYYGVGYATFEKELFEALRIYNVIQALPENARHYLLERLVNDDVRIYGFENVTFYMNYENLIKLLLISLLGAQELKGGQGPITLNFMELVEKIENRYEAVNDSLNKIPLERVWGDTPQVNHFFKAETGLVFKREDSKNILSIDFVDRMSVSNKITHMETIEEVEQLKNYFHYSLQSLKATTFNTEDYETELEGAFKERLKEITEMMLDEAKKRMGLLKDFREIHGMVDDLLERALEIGFTDEQQHRLMDLYELRKADLRREKLVEIDRTLEKITEGNELEDYWSNIKWYLIDNRPFWGKEFETLIARRFDNRSTGIENKAIIS